MFSGIIYKAISPSNKIYFGKTSRTLNERIKEHKQKSNYEKFHFSHAIKKYGIDKFSWEIIETYQKESLEELQKILNEREKFWIKREKTYLREYGYNMTDGGEGTAGLKRTFSEEHKKSLSLSHLGKTLAEEHKNNIGKSGKGRVFSEEHKKNLRNNWEFTHPNNGKNPSKETREKLRQKSLKVKKTICNHCQKEFTPWGLKRHQTKLKNINYVASR